MCSLVADKSSTAAAAATSAREATPATATARNVCEYMQKAVINNSWSGGEKVKTEREKSEQQKQKYQHKHFRLPYETIYELSEIQISSYPLTWTWCQKHAAFQAWFIKTDDAWQTISLPLPLFCAGQEPRPSQGPKPRPSRMRDKAEQSKKI